ncbi:MAG: DMT family transporter [Methylococcaceae bacterium]
MQHQSLSSENKRNLLVGSSYVLIAAIGFSAKAVIIKLAYGYGAQVDAITLMALRMLMALPVFLWVGFWQGKKKGQIFTLKDLLRVFILGGLGYYLASFLDFTGLQFISAGLERVILFLYPTFVVLLSAVIFRRPITLREVMALLLSYAGMIWVFQENMQQGSSDVLKGSVLVLLSAISFALFLMGSGMMVKRIGSGRFTAYSMTVACIATLVHFASVHDFTLLKLPRQVYYLAALMALFSTVIPAFLMNAGIQRIGSGTASMISSVGPIGTLILAYIFLGEELSSAQIIGTFLVLTGVFIASRAKS